MNRTHGNHWAHAALLELKSVVVASGSRGIRKMEVDRSLGIYHGYTKDGGGEEHRGHISSVLLHEPARERFVRQLGGRLVAAGGS